MRLAHSLIFAGALLVAVPASAQDNAVAPDNTVVTNEVDANLLAPAPGDPATNGAVVAPADQSAALPPSSTTTVDTTAPAPERARGFPWGVLGLLGLVGLLGVRKVRG